MQGEALREQKNLTLACELVSGEGHRQQVDEGEDAHQCQQSEDCVVDYLKSDAALGFFDFHFRPPPFQKMR